MKIALLLLVFFYGYTTTKAQNFPYLNASAGNKNDFIVDVDSNIFMFHGGRIEKLDKNFNPIWINNYSGLSFKNLLLSKTGSMFFIASNASSDNIGKIEANGNLTLCYSLPSYTATISGNTQTVSIASADQMLLDRNANIVITGTTNNNMYILKLDTLGNFLKLRFSVNDLMVNPKNSTIINDVSGIYNVSSWGYGFEGPVYNLVYKYNDLSDFIVDDSTFQMGNMGMTNQNPSSNEQIIKSKMESNVFYLCNNTGAFSSTLQNTFSFRKIKNTTIKWGVQFQTFSPYLMSLQNMEEDNSKNVFLSVSCKNVSNNKVDKWIVKVDSNGLSDNKKYNLLQNFGKATFANEDSIVQLKHHYGNSFFYSIETSSSLPGPLSITKMDSTVGSYCSPTASINVTSNPNYYYELGSVNHSTLTSVSSVTMSSISSSVTSVSNFSVMVNSCLALNLKGFDINHVISIYPNPTSKNLNIHTLSNNTVFESTIFDITGKQVLTSIDQTSIDVSKLNSGLYFIKIKTDQGEFSRKFIKE